MNEFVSKRVLQIGFNKCGTRSFTRLFRRSGHRSAHCMCEYRDLKKLLSDLKYTNSEGRTRIASLIQQNLVAGRPALYGLHHYAFLCDMEVFSETRAYEAFKHFPTLHEQYPKTKFILNLRDKDRWIESRINHREGRLVNLCMKREGLADLDAVVALWRADWDTHIANVRSYFKDIPHKLIEFNIETDPIEKLVEALPEYKLNPEYWENAGSTQHGNVRAKFETSQTT